MEMNLFLFDIESIKCNSNAVMHEHISKKCGLLCLKVSFIIMKFYILCNVLCTASTKCSDYIFDIRKIITMHKGNDAI